MYNKIDKNDKQDEIASKDDCFKSKTSQRDLVFLRDPHTSFITNFLRIVNLLCDRVGISHNSIAVNSGLQFQFGFPGTPI